MSTTTWIFGVRRIGGDEAEPMFLAALLADEDVVASTLLEHAPTDAELSALYTEALEGQEGDGPRVPPKVVLVENAPTAKRVRPLFKKGARVEIERGITTLLDELAEEVIERAVDAEVFEAMPEAWRTELVPLGAELEEAAPWEKLPPAALLRVSSPALGLDDGRVSVLGERSKGFVVFPTAEVYDAFHASALAMTKGQPAQPFPRIAGLEVVDVWIESEPTRVAIVDARTHEGSVDATEEDLRRCVALARLVTAYVEQGEPSAETRKWWF